MKYILLIIVLFCGLIQSCSPPDQFLLNIRKGQMIGGLIMSSIDSVEVLSDNSIQLYGGGQIAMRHEKMTQSVADITVKIEQGDGLRFATRSVSNNFDNHPAILFDYTVNGSKVSEKGKFEIKVDSIKASLNDIRRIRIINYGKHFAITVDCDTVYSGWTELPATEYVLIQALSKTKAILTGIDIIQSDIEE